MPNELFVDNANVLTLKDLVINQNGEMIPITNATVTASLFDGCENAISNAQDISLAYVTNTQSDYSGVLPSNAQLQTGETYTIRYRAIAQSGQELNRSIDAVAMNK